MLLGFCELSFSPRVFGPRQAIGRRRYVAPALKRLIYHYCLLRTWSLVSGVGSYERPVLAMSEAGGHAPHARAGAAKQEILILNGDGDQAAVFEHHARGIASVRWPFLHWARRWMAHDVTRSTRRR